jgi:hypothetical protein
MDARRALGRPGEWWKLGLSQAEDVGRQVGGSGAVGVCGGGGLVVDEVEREYQPR